MKANLGSSFAFFLVTITAYSQSVPKVEITDPILTSVLKNFIDDCKQLGGFRDKMGVITVKEGVDRKTYRKRYELNLIIDDRYKDDPPNSYGYLIHQDVPYMALFYVNGSVVKVADKAAYLEQMTYEIGDRLYQRPAVKGRWTLYTPRGGQTVWAFIEDKPNQGGQSLYGRVYVIDSDGLYTKLKTL